MIEQIPPFLTELRSLLFWENIEKDLVLGSLAVQVEIRMCLCKIHNLFHKATKVVIKLACSGCEAMQNSAVGEVGDFSILYSINLKTVMSQFNESNRSNFLIRIENRNTL